jgi:hypothetical protein
MIKEWVKCENVKCGRPKHKDRLCVCEIEEKEEERNVQKI